MIGWRTTGLLCLALGGCVTNNVTDVQAVRTQATAASLQGSQISAPARPGPPTGAQLAAARFVRVDKTVLAGSEIDLTTSRSLNGDCSPHGHVEARVVSQPAHGTVTIEDATIYPTFAPNHPLNHCNGRKAMATVVKYRAESGYTGSDVAVVEVFFPSGNSPTMTFNIAVK